MPKPKTYREALSGMGKLGWLAAFIYTAGAGLRLARFNTQVGVADKRFFRGLPSPSAAALVVGLVWVLHANGVPGREISIAALIMTVMAGMLMVSNIRYRSFKDVNLRGRVSFMTILSLPLVLVLLFQDPPQVLFLTFLVYALSGPLGFLFRRAHREAKDHPEKHPHGQV